jgi:hypothetical protein
MEQFQLEKKDLRGKLLAHFKKTEDSLSLLASGCHQNK